MEGLWLVEAVAIGSPVLVSVQILFGLPRVTVPELAVALVTTCESVGALLDLKLSRVLEDTFVAAGPPVGTVVSLGANVARPSRRLGVVFRLVVRRCVEHGTRAKATASGLHGYVLFRDKRGIKATLESETVSDAKSYLPSGGVVVARRVNDRLLEDVTRLLCYTLAEVLVVDLDLWDVALVAGNHGSLPLCRFLYPHAEYSDLLFEKLGAKITYLVAHVVVAGPIEVLVRPLGERVLLEPSFGTMVLERVFRV